MGNNNNWQVQAPSINLYALDGMYKNRNIIPTGENTLVNMLQDAWNTGKKALQEDFKNNVIGNTDSAEITRAKAQGMTTNQYLQNQASNKGWLMDYIANPLSNPEVQAAADAADKQELAEFEKSFQKRNIDKYVRDHEGAINDASADILKGISNRPYAEQVRLRDAASSAIVRGLAEEFLDPHGEAMQQLNAERLAKGLSPISLESLANNPNKLYQALRTSMNYKTDSAYRLIDTVGGKKGFDSLFEKGSNGKSSIEEMLGIGGRYSNALTNNREALEALNAFRADFSDMTNLTPESLDTWAQQYLASRGIPPNSGLAKTTLVGINGMIRNEINGRYRAMMDSLQYYYNNGKTDSASLANIEALRQQLIDFKSKWGDMLSSENSKTFTELDQRANRFNMLNEVLKQEQMLNGAKNAGNSLIDVVDSGQIDRFKTDPRVSRLFSEFKDNLKQAVKNDPELQKLNISDDDYDRVTYHFLNKASTPLQPLYDRALSAGVDLRNPKGDYINNFNKVFNPNTFSELDKIQMNPKAALKTLATKRSLSQSRNNYQGY